MREQDDRDGGRAAFDIVFKSFELFVAQIAESARLKIDDID